MWELATSLGGPGRKLGQTPPGRRRVADGRRVRWGGQRLAVYIVGARPNFVKMAPLVSEMRGRVVAAVRRRPYRPALRPRMSDLLFEDLGLSRPDHLLGVGSGRMAGRRHAHSSASRRSCFKSARCSWSLPATSIRRSPPRSRRPNWVGIVAHLEAGLRSFDRRMPEEVNRVCRSDVGLLPYSQPGGRGEPDA